VEISLICFFGHNFGTRYSRKSIQPSKDLYYSLVPNKKIKSKNRSWHWHPALDDCHPNIHKYA